MVTQAFVSSLQNNLFDAKTTMSPTESTTLAKVEVSTTSQSSKSKSRAMQQSTAEAVTKPMTTFNSSLLKPTTRSRYCELFEEEDDCNSDKDCSWCNLLDQCFGRNKEDLKLCARNEKRSEVDDAGMFIRGRFFLLF